jgi:hypothetical protein
LPRNFFDGQIRPLDLKFCEFSAIENSCAEIEVANKQNSLDATRRGNVFDCLLMKELWEGSLEG